MQPPILLSEPSRRVFCIMSACADAAASAWHRYLHRRRLQSAIRHLEGLSDFALKDIGLHRGEITAAVMEGERAVLAKRLADARDSNEDAEGAPGAAMRTDVRPARRFIHRI